METKKLCVVVPYRDRKLHLELFLPHIEKTLQDQNINYLILVVEQTFEKPFNRAKLLNIGFDYTKGKYDNYCFHDVDMLAIESDYSYVENPTHLAARAEQFGYKLPYQNYFGGVTIFDKETFKEINGYSNKYFSWGAEDDDIFLRCEKINKKIFRKNCMFKSLFHERKIDDQLYRKNLHTLHTFDTRLVDNVCNDGLSDLEYSILDEKANGKIFHIVVNL